MRKDLTHVTLLVDRSGSMKSCLVEAQDGANQNAFKQAGKFSIDMGAVANYTVADSASAFEGLSNNVRRMRKNTSKGLLAVNEYTSDERRAMEGQNS